MKALATSGSLARAAAGRLARLGVALLGSGWLLAAPAASAQSLGNVQLDKARYNPGQVVQFTADLGAAQAGLTLEIRYYHLGQLLSQQVLPAAGRTVAWSWTPPGTDFRGYLVGLKLTDANQDVVDETVIGVDVSSSWTRFPRYGFLSKFGPMTSAQIEAQLRQLNRFHLNGLQYYDWMDKHHQPLAGTPAAPAAQWNDLANRATYFATVKGYIDKGHDYGISAMFYNLLYGAYANAAADGVSEQWSLYRDATHTNRYVHPLPSTWEGGGLALMDPANSDWRTYLLAAHDNVYAAAGLNFDGWHADQLGDPDSVYTYGGQQTNPSLAFGSFLTAAKQAQPTKALVMNAVNQWGQAQIAAAPVDFTYSELWTGNEEYRNLAEVIQTNEQLSGGKPTVLAAYVNKGKSGSTGFFNDASVLLADATIFAFGGAHIELGEHMLGNEYFPNSNLQLSALLRRDLTTYYDFAVGYQNLLRDGRTFNNVPLTGGATVQAWPPVAGKVAAVGASYRGGQIFHLLNFRQAQTLNWRDDQQVQPVPTPVSNLSLSFPYATPVTRLWAASPDVNNGLPQPLPFTQTGGSVSFQLPQLKYWTMVVAETGTTTPAKTGAAPVDFGLQNAPNPFRGTTTIRFTLPARAATTLTVQDLHGRLVRVLHTGRLDAGTHQLTWAAETLPAGVYLCQLKTPAGTATRRLVKLD